MTAAAALASLALAVAAAPGDLRELVRKSLAGLDREEERRGEFLFKARTERKELDSAGKAKSSHSHVWERIEIDGVPFGRTLERDGKPLTAVERKAEDEAMRKRLGELKQAATIGAAAPAGPRKRAADDQWVQEFPEALDYTLAGEEILNGRPAYRLSAVPKPGYQPKNMRARVFEKMKAQLWIDKETAELAKVDAEMFDTVSVGFGVLGRIDKGTRFHLQRRPVEPGVWLIDSQQVRFSARLLLFKNLHSESATQWSEFRRRAAKPKP